MSYWVLEFKFRYLFSDNGTNHLLSIDTEILLSSSLFSLMQKLHWSLKKWFVYLLYFFCISYNKYIGSK